MVMRMDKLSLIGACVAACLFGAIASASADDHTAENHIKAVLSGMFDRPDQPLQVGPVVAVGEHAVAGWTQGDNGGRALLRKNGNEWSIILCSGDQLKSDDVLLKVGVPAAAAKQLSARLAEAESRADPKRVAQFSRFDGIVMMDQQGHHPPPHQHHRH